MLEKFSQEKTVLKLRKKKEKNYISNSLVYRLSSPIFLSTLMTVLSILFSLYPVGLYESALKERDYMFLNIKLISFMSLCYFAFLSGILIFRKLPALKYKQIRLGISTKNLLRFFLIVAIFLMTASLVLIISKLKFNGYISSIAGRNDSSRLDILNTLKDGGLTWTNQFALPMIVFSIWTLATRRVNYLKILLYSAVLLYLANIAPSQSKEPILKFFLVLGITWIAAKISIGKFKPTRTALVLAVLSIAVLLILSGIQSRRLSGYNNETATVSTDLAGYFPASYNRLALLLDGRLNVENQGFPYYTTQWFWAIPVVQDVNFFLLDSLEIKYPSNSYDAWIKSFANTYEAGLNPRYIWVTIFGYVFSDFGWLSPIWFLLYGIFCEGFYRSWKKGRVAGIIVYPFLFISNLQWYATVSVGATRDVLFAVFITIILSAAKREDRLTRSNGTLPIEPREPRTAVPIGNLR